MHIGIPMYFQEIGHKTLHKEILYGQKFTLVILERNCIQIELALFDVL